jgi:hypothetical protein
VTDVEPFEIPTLPALVPLRSAHELKERTLRDYSRNAGLPGMPSDPAAIERLVMADLNLSDAYEREEGPPVARAPESAEARDTRQEADRYRIEHETGAQLVREKPGHVGPALDLPPEIESSERWALARGRLARIMEGASLSTRHPDGSLDFRSMTSTCNYPAGAYELLTNWFSFDLRYAWQTRRHNPFYGMSHRDASLKFVRLATDICDRSSVVLGTWFTPR